MRQSAEGETERDVRDSDRYIEDAVRMIDSGAISIEEVEAHEYHDLTDEELRAAVREKLDSDEDTNDPESEDLTTETSAIDWPELFTEFGFDSENAAGNIRVSRTKLLEAIRVSEQQIAGSASEHIDAAVEEDIIATVHAVKPEGGSAIAGYRLGGAA